MPFCPECKIEYMEGFTTCKDCHILLVDKLPDEIQVENGKKEHRLSIMKKKLIPICCMTVAVVLMSLPYGVPTGPKEYRTSFYQQFTTSYFNISYESNWFPIITVLLSIVLLVMLVVNYIKKKDYIGKLICILLSICIVASPLSWLIYGGAYTMTLIGIIVFLLHVATLTLQIKSKKSST